MKYKINNFKNSELLVSPSILAAEFAGLGDDISRIEEAGADILHLDIMDGHFVPNISFGPPIVSKIRPVTGLLFDVHLMLTNPLDYVDSFCKSGADHITFHIECDNDPDEVIKKINSNGVSAGLCIKPKTPASEIIPFLDKVSMILVMSVEPGFGGQSFMHDTMPKITKIRQVIKDQNLNTHVEVDGGIDSETVGIAAKAGANVMVAGTSVFRNPVGAEKAIADLHDAQKVLFC